MENGGPNEPRVVRLNRRQIKILAHPLRFRLLGALRVEGSATATMLAERLATNTGATSYHLRQLADVGLVVEDPGRGAGRQRWWRAAHDMSSWRPSDFDDDPDARAASDWIQSHGLRAMVEEAQRWLDGRSDAPAEWRDAADFSDFGLTLTPQRLRALNDELVEVVRRYQRESSPDEENAAQVIVLLAGFPRQAVTR